MALDGVAVAGRPLILEIGMTVIGEVVMAAVEGVDRINLGEVAVSKRG